MFFTLGCKKESLNNKNSIVQIKQSNSLKKELEFDNKDTRTLVNKDFTLRVESDFSKDTLDVVDYKEDKFSSPIITAQKLSFFKKDKLLKSYELPIKILKKKTINKSIIAALQTPIYKLCVSKSLNEDFYIIYGSDFCNGSKCPEFIGIYSMSGDIIYEGVSTEENRISLKDIVEQHKIELNKSTNCIKIDNLK